MAVNIGFSWGTGNINSEPVRNINGLISKIQDFFDVAVWFLISLAVIFIVWRGFEFIRQADNEEARAKNKLALMWGIVGLFVILSIWGLVNILGNTFGTGNADNAWQVQNDVNSLILDAKSGPSPTTPIRQ